MKKIFLAIILFFLTLGITQAQEKPQSSLGYTPSSYYTASWNMTFPLGDFKDWVSRAGLGGFDIGGRYFIINGLAAGFNISWNRIYEEYTNTTYTIPDKGIALTATNYRFTWMVPFQAVIAYHLHPEKMISPFVGLGIGGDYMEHHLLIQEYDIYNTRWDFSLSPEIGVLAKFGSFSNWGAMVSFNYKWTTNKIELYEKTSENLQMLNLKIGLAYVLR